MKKLLYFLMTAAAFFFAACSDQNDVVDDLIDEVENSPVVKSIDYTLTSVDYGTISAAAVKDAGDNEANKALANAVKSTNSLNSFVKGDKYIPAILAAKYPALGLESAVRVTYAYTPDHLATLPATTTYTVSAADYETVWGADADVQYLTPANSPANELPAILKAAYPAAEAGDMVVVSYKYSDQEPNLGGGGETPPPASLSENFDGYAVNDEVNQNGWSQFDETGTRKWLVKAYSGNQYAEVTSYGSPAEAENNVYLVSPEIDLAGYTAPIFSFDAELRFPVADQDYLRVLVSTDYVSPESATWVDVTDNFTLPTTANGAPEPAGSMSLAAYTGKIRVAFKYQGSGTTSPAMTTTLRIDNVSVTGVASTVAAQAKAMTTRAVISAPVTEKAFWSYDGTKWSLDKAALIVNTGDYKAMGVESLTALTAPNYLPAFLAQKVEYAQKNQKVAVMYGSLADEYVYDGAVWSNTLTGAPFTDQYVYDGTKWIFDPSINHTMTTADHKMVIDYMLADPEWAVYVQQQYKNEEFYYGFSSRYTNVSFRLSYRMTGDTAELSKPDKEFHDLDGDTTAQIKLLWSRLEQEGMPLFLQLKYPDSPVILQGVQLYYNVTVAVHSPDDGTTVVTKNYKMRYKVLTAGSAGNPPTFEFVSKTKL